MNPTRVTNALVVAAALGAALLSASPASAEGTAFTYQGRLDASGVPSNGLHDLRFQLWTAATGGVAVGTPVCVDDVEVVAGVFMVRLDFGPQFGATSERYLEIEVRQDTGASCADLSGFVLLSPRQEITAAPRASHANSAFALDAADGLPAGAVYVDNDGKVGIGTTSPAKQIHVQGTAPAIILQDMSSASSQAGYLSFWNNVAAETGWIGYGSAGSPHFSIVNARAGGNISLEALTVTSAGSVGIGTAAPAAALDVRGDIRLGPTGQYQAPAGEERLRILRGRITSTGAISFGTGFTAARTATGLYTITPNTPFSSTPTLVISPSVASTGGPYGAHTNGVSATVAAVRIVTGSGTNIDDTFDFILVGPR